MSKFSIKFNIFLSIFLLVGVTFSIVSITRATTPNPGHSWSQTGDGVFAITGPTALRTFTFPDTDATVVTTANNLSSLSSTTSLQLLNLISDETGTGSLVLSTSPTLVTPILGTVASGNFSTGTFSWPTFNQNTSGTASNITAYTINQNVGTANSPTFAGATLTGTLGMGANTITSGLINSQTISNAANFTGSLTMNGAFANTSASNSYFTGNVGIGTTNPGYKLDITGDGHFSTNLNVDSILNVNSYFQIFHSGGNTYIQTPGGEGENINLRTKGTGYLSLGTGGSEKMRLSTTGGLSLGNSYAATDPGSGSMIISGNVGIGTTAPGSKLSILGGGISLKNSVSATSGSTIYPLGDAGGLLFRTDSGLSTSATAFSFSTYNGGYADRMIILGNGNVGIGTTNPGAKLEIGVASGDTLFKFSNFKWDFISTATDPYNLGVNTTLVGLDQSYIKNLQGSQNQVLTFSDAADSNSTIFGIGSSIDGAVTWNPRLVVKQGGNVGIGTTGPLAPLHVFNGTTIATTALSNVPTYASLIIQPFGGTSSNGLAFGMVGNNSQSLQGFYTGNNAATAPIALNPFGGNVGIGTTNPNIYGADPIYRSVLTIAGPVLNGDTAGVLELASRDNGANGRNVGNIVFTYNTNTGDKRVAEIDSYSKGSTITGPNDRGGVLAFWTKSDLGTLSQRMRIDSEGNVGIGTINPVAKLQVSTDGSTPNSSLIPSVTSVVLSSTATSRLAILAAADTTVLGHFVAVRARGTLASPTIVSNGDWILELSGEGYDGSTDRNAASIRMYVDGGTPSATSMPGSIRFLTTPVGGTDVTEKMRIDNAGNVGIGTTNPSTDKLVVVGDIRVGTSGTNGCIERFDGAALTGSCSSDSRLKTNIVPIGNVLEKFVQLNPVTFNWRASEFPDRGFGTDTVRGLIAQDVEQLFPELVGKDGKGFKTVNYGVDMQMFSIEAIKELNLKINDLSTKVASLGDGRGNISDSMISSLFDAIMTKFKDIYGVVWENGILKIANIVSDKLSSKEVNTDKLCVGTTCVTETELKSLLEKNQIGNAGEAVIDANVDQNAADIVINKIAVLPLVDSLTLADKTSVEIAKTSYDTLTDIQKTLVTNLGILIADEAKIIELQTAADAAAAT